MSWPCRRFRKRPPAPDGERFPQPFTRVVCPSGRKRPAPLLGQGLEAMEVELTGNDRQHVAARTREKDAVVAEILRFRARLGEQLSQLRNERLDALGRTRRRLRAPEVLDDLVDRHDLVRAQQEQSEQGALLMPAE